MSDLRKRTQEINAEYWSVREEQSERVAVAQLTLVLARTELEVQQARDAALAEAAGRLAELRCHPNITSAGWLSFPDPNGAFVEYAAAIAALRSGGAG